MVTMGEVNKDFLRIDTDTSVAVPPEFLSREVLLQGGPESSLFSQRKGTALGLEQFRLLQTRLTELQTQEPFKRLLVTSAVQGEGKTHVTANLALTLATEGGRKVLVIDADVYNPALHLAFGLPNDSGLGNWFRVGREPWKVMSKIKGKDLYVMTGGSGGSKSLSQSNLASLQTLLDQVSSAFDLILIDAPPLLTTVDARLLSTVADAALLVVRAGSTPREVVLKAKQMIERQPILGIILNRLDPTDDCYALHYQYGIYGERARSRDKRKPSAPGSQRK